jgi:hypothetical protein
MATSLLKIVLPKWARDRVCKQYTAAVLGEYHTSETTF